MPLSKGDLTVDPIMISIKQRIDETGMSTGKLPALASQSSKNDSVFAL